MSTMAQVWRFAAPPIYASRAFVRRHPTLRRMLQPWLRRLADSLRLRPTEISAAAYRRWIKDHDTLNDQDRAAILADIAALPARPLISVVMPIHALSETLLRQAIASMRAQLYPVWELYITAGAASSAKLAPLLEKAAADDCRIRCVRPQIGGSVGVAAATAFASATGAWVTLVDPHDTLAEAALYEVAAEIAAHPHARVIYSDEDRVDENGKRSAPYFKPDFDPDLLLGQNYLGHLTVYRRDLVQHLGEPWEMPDVAMGHDLALRAIAAIEPADVRHIPSVLYHRRLADASGLSPGAVPDSCAGASRRAVRELLSRRGVVAPIVPAPLAPAFSRVIWPLPDPAPLVSVIVPTRDRAALLERCLDGVLHRTDYGPIEVLVIDNGSQAPETLALFAKLAADPRVRVLAMPGAFNYAALNNRTARLARGEVLLLLNNDVEVIDGGWLREMVSQVLRPGVGAVGAKLLYGTGRLQHAGTVLGVGGVAHHYRTGARRSAAGPFGSLALCRSVSAVTAACLAIRRAVFEEVGGLDENHLPVAFNDVDLCLRVRACGYRNVWTPFAELYHLESVSRGLDRSGEAKARFQREQTYMRKRWAAALESDPYWNPNFSLENANGTLAFPPRLEKTWRRALRPASG